MPTTRLGGDETDPGGQSPPFADADRDVQPVGDQHGGGQLADHDPALGAGDELVDVGLARVVAGGGDSTVECAGAQRGVGGLGW